MVTPSAPNPYAPPTTDEAADETFLPGDYRPSGLLAAALKCSLGASALISFVEVGSDWMQINLLEHARGGAIVSVTEAEANDNRVQMLAVAFLLSFLVSAVLWAVWQNRTNKNARALGAENLEYGPNAWGWFFCPFLNLWRPLQAVRELWLVADHRSHNMMAPPVFSLWWGAWIIGNIVSRIATKMAEGSDDLDLLINASYVDLVANLTLGLAGVCAVLVVTTIVRREQSGYARHRAGPSGTS